MLAIHTLVFALGAFLSLPQTILGGLVQSQSLEFPPEIDATANQDTIKQIFTDSYAVYKKYAFTHDEVAPISETSIDDYDGWAATIIDSLDTMLIMGLEDGLFLEAIAAVSAIDFTKAKTSDLASVFESTIRHVGGMLSAYELSHGKYPILVEKATQLADQLAFAWVGKNVIPFGHININTSTPNVATTNIAEAGTLTLEWATLSKYTGNDTYRSLAENSVRHIAQVGKPLPGLPAQGIDPSSGKPVGGYVTWGGGSDSFFEYLIKYARLNNTADPLFADTWRTAVDSSIKTLLKTSTVGGHVYLADYDDEKKIRHVGSHLACFYGGNWLLGGKLLDDDNVVGIALQLVDACWNTYASTATGIGPEVFAFASSDGNYTGGTPATAAQIDFYNEHGFYITAPDYILRPEVLESNFYAWRVTGDSKYLERAEQAIKSFETYCKVENNGYAGLINVDDNSSSRQMIDDTESFWFGEVLKYLSLTFDDPNNISLDKYVFNTECHPFQAAPASWDTSYGTGSPITSFPPFTPIGGNLPAVSAIPAIPDLVFGPQGIFGKILGHIIG